MVSTSDHRAGSTLPEAVRRQNLASAKKKQFVSTDTSNVSFMKFVEIIKIRDIDKVIISLLNQLWENIRIWRKV